MRRANRQIFWVWSWRDSGNKKRLLRRSALAAVLIGGAVLMAATGGAAAIASQLQTGGDTAQQYPLQTAPPYTVALDAGHGGMDTGAEEIVVEVFVCEKTVDDLFDLLEADPNYTPVRTRPNGEDRSTAERVKAASEQQASALISVHANSDSSSQSHGFECYPTPPGRVYSEQSMQLATCICNEMKAAGNRLCGNHGVYFAYYSGKRKTIVSSTDTTVRKQKSFGMVDKTQCPSILVEQCFLTNYNDVENWATDAGCQKAAGVYYRAICTYFGTQPMQDGLTAS